MRTVDRKPLGPLPALIFSSRWLQLPLYLGLIVAQGVYLSALGIARTDRIMSLGVNASRKIH